MTTINKIYAEIEKESYDKAIKLCGQKDVKDLLLVQSLLAFCQVQIGKKAEALETARKVARSNPIDDAVIRTLTHTFKSCRVEDELVQVYEYAVEFNSNAIARDELSADLFYLLNRLGEYKKMQALATKLYKSSGKSHFLFWSICSMLLQHDLPPQMLVVGERMIAKIFNDSYSNCQPGAEEIELYIHIITKQGKYLEALNLLDKIMENPAGALVNENDDFVANGSQIKLSKLRLATLRGELLTALLPGKMPELILQLKHILSIYPDQWIAHEQLIDCVYKSFDTQESKAESILVEYQQYLLDIQRANPKIRGPYLAELLFMQTMGNGATAQLPSGWTRAGTVKSCKDFTVPTLQEVNSSTETPVSDASVAFYEDFCLLLLHYIDKFQTKQCCFSDIKKYCDCIHTHLPTVHTQSVISWSNTRSNQLLIDLETIIASHKSNPEQSNRDKTIEVLCSYSKMNQISYYCNLLLRNNDQNVTKYTDNGIIKLHQATVDLCRGGIGGDREVQPNDELLSIFACASRYAYSVRSENKSQALVKWASALLYSMNVSPYNYAFKLDLLEPLRQLAMGESALAAFTGLGAKYVQFDSMSYLIIPVLMECGMYSECLYQHRCVLSFHMSASRDTADMMSKCYKHCNYMKCLELKKFIKRCSSSLQLAITRAEMPFIELIEKYHSLNDVTKYLTAGGYTENAGANIVSDRTHLDSLIDNNDYNLVVSPDLQDETLAKNSAERRVQYYQRINTAQLLLQLLVAMTTKNGASTSECLAKILLSVSEEREPPASELKWNQNLNGFNTKSEDNVVWNVLHSLVKYYIAVIALKVASDADVAALDASTVSEVSNLAQQCIEAIVAAKEFILNEIHIYVNIPAEKKTKGAKGTSAAEPTLFLLNPSWIRGVSKFVRIIGVMVPALLQVLCGHMNPVGQKDKKKNKNKKEITAYGTLQEGLHQVTHHFIKLVEDLVRQLEKSSDSDTLCGSNVLHVLMQWDNSSTLPVLQSSKQLLADQMASSQQLSCNRLAQVLRNKLIPLKDL